MNFSFGVPTSTAAAKPANLFGVASTSSPLTSAVAEKPANLFGGTTTVTPLTSAVKPSVIFGGSPGLSALPSSLSGLPSISTSTSTLATASPLTSITSNVAPTTKSAFSLGLSASLAPSTSAATTTANNTGFSLGLQTTSAASSPALTSALTSSLTSSLIKKPADPVMTDTTYREIEKDIGNWTKELIADEQAFLTQATKINSWDNQLIHNANQISNLNDEVTRVKVDQDNLEAELAFIDTQQTQLEEMLIPVERSLGLKAEDGSSLPCKQYQRHADLEREQTYKMAGNIDLQLKRINLDLNEVIEYVNYKTSSNDSSNPVNQILRIINSQIDSLQWIEKNTAILNEKTNSMGKQMELQKELKFKN